MTDRVAAFSGPGRTLFATSLLATILALVALLGTATLLMMLTLGGFVVIVLIATDALLLSRVVLQGLAVVGPITMVLLPALTLLCRHQPRLLRWLLLLAAPLAGGWWGRSAALWWLGDGNVPENFVAVLGMIGGLTAGIVFARRG